MNKIGILAVLLGVSALVNVGLWVKQMNDASIIEDLQKEIESAQEKNSGKKLSIDDFNKKNSDITWNEFRGNLASKTEGGEYGIRELDWSIANDSLHDIWPNICKFQRNELENVSTPICLLLEIEEKEGNPIPLLENFSKVVESGVDEQGLPLGLENTIGISPYTHDIQPLGAETEEWKGKKE